MPAKKESGAQGRKRHQEMVEKAEKEAANAAKFFKTFHNACPIELDKADDPNAEALPEPTSFVVEASDSDIVASTSETEATRSETEAARSETEAERSEIEAERSETEAATDEVPIELIDDQNVYDPVTENLVTELKDIGALQFSDVDGRAIVSRQLKQKLFEIGLEKFQHANGPFEPTDNRAMNSNWFYKPLGEGKSEKIFRSFLAYSPSKRAAFCLCCILFSQAPPKSNFEKSDGFTKWKKLEKLREHENAPNHRQCFIQMKEYERTLKCKVSLDKELEKQIENEKKKWRDILMRLFQCIKYLAVQNLALRGHRESLGPH